MKYIIQKFTLTLDNNTGETDPLPPSLLTARLYLMQLAKQWAGLQVIMQQLIGSLSRVRLYFTRVYVHIDQFQLS